MRTGRLLAAAVLSIIIAGCSTVPATSQPSSAHIRTESTPPPVAGRIPAPVQQAPVLPKPRPAAKTETYSVVVNNVRVQDLLFALARDARLNVDIHPGIVGTVTLNAIDQTLPQLLNRIARQTDMRYELDGPNLAVMPDSPYLRTYKVNYVNMSREITGTVSINTQIASGGSSGSTSGSVAGGSIGSGNTSSTSIENKSKNRFWEDLEKNVKDLLRETDKLILQGAAETVQASQASTQTSQSADASGSGQARTQQGGPILGLGTGSYGQGNQRVQGKQDAGEQFQSSQGGRVYSYREAASVIVHPETGVVTVRATSRQHEKIQEFLDHVLTSARRQVLIEATIVEVTLNDGYQQGIEWSRLRPDGSGFNIQRPTVNTNTTDPFTPFILRYLNKSSPLDLSITLRFLESFGSVKVLSSPRLSVLNNQTALLKVVDSIVYFNIKSDTSQQANAGTLTTVTSTAESVSVGLVMAVTPQINESDSVMLNVRPTISSVFSFQPDPVNAGNSVPQIRTREIESILRVSNGDVAVLGGLMEDRVDYKTGRLPLIGAIPGLGEVFTSRNNAMQKTELVIFLRPIVVREASVAGDYRGYREQLPADDFLDDPQARERRLPTLEGLSR